MNLTPRNVPRITNEQRIELERIEREIADARTHQRARNKKRKPKTAVLLGLKKLGDFE